MYSMNPVSVYTVGTMPDYYLRYVNCVNWVTHSSSLSMTKQPFVKPIGWWTSAQGQAKLVAGLSQVDP